MAQLPDIHPFGQLLYCHFLYAIGSRKRLLYYQTAIQIKHPELSIIAVRMRQPQAGIGRVGPLISPPQFPQIALPFVPIEIFTYP